MAQASCNWTENTFDANPMLRPLGPLGQLDKNYWTLLQTRPDKNAHSCSCLDSSWEQLKGMTIECLCFCAKQTQVDPPLQQTSANFGKVHSWAQVVATLCLRKCRRRGSLRMKTEWQALWVQLQMSDVELVTTSITLTHHDILSVLQTILRCCQISLRTLRFGTTLTMRPVSRPSSASQAATLVRRAVEAWTCRHGTSVDVNTISIPWVFVRNA